MILTSFQKGLVMTIVTLIAATLAQLPAGTFGWEVFGITSLSTIVIYIAKNAIFPSTSIAGVLTTSDLWSGLIMAVGSGLSQFAADAISKTVVDFKSLGILMITVITGYILKTVNTTAIVASTTSTTAKTT